MSNICKRPKVSRWWLETKISSYYERNKKLSPLHELEYNFIRGLYIYLSGQSFNQEFKDNLYQNYTLLIDVSYSWNRDSPNPKMLEIIYLGCQILLDFQITGPYTFILLNNNWHYRKMKYTLDMIYTWSLSPSYYDYADKDEFWELMEYLKKEFNSHKVDFKQASGKYPRVFRKRFNRL